MDNNKNYFLFLMFSAIILVLFDIFFIQDFNGKETVALVQNNDEDEVNIVCEKTTLKVIRRITLKNIKEVELDYFLKGKPIIRYRIGLPGEEVRSIEFPFFVDQHLADETKIFFCIDYETTGNQI